MNKRKLKLLEDGVKLTVKELVMVKKWIIVEIFLIILEIIVWILSIFNHAFYLTFLLPLITVIYISFFVPQNKIWWKNTKLSSPTKKITGDIRYLYIFSRNDNEFRRIIRLMYISPSIISMAVILTCIMDIVNAYLLMELNIEYARFTFSKSLSIIFQVVIVLWIVFRLIYLKRFHEISDLFSDKAQTGEINKNV